MTNKTNKTKNRKRLSIMTLQNIASYYIFYFTAVGFCTITAIVLFLIYKFTPVKEYVDLLVNME